MYKLIVSALIVLNLFGCTKQHASSETEKNDLVENKRPNILWIYIEDQNAWNNAWGDFTVDTPNILALANSGVKFSNVHQPAPVCSATRSALITGKYQTTLGVHQHRSYRSEYNGHFLPKGYKTVPELFISAGYKTFNIGKDDYNFKYDRSKIYNAHEGVKGYQGGHNGKEFDWASELSAAPFFGQIQLKGGKHSTFSAEVPDVDPNKMDIPPYYYDGPETRKEWAKHYKTQVVSDIELGDILEKLKANGILQNTAIFWFSDHGMGLLRHKQELYEGGVNVPLIVNWPDGKAFIQKKGSTRNELISGLDIPATSLALAGIELPNYLDGQNVFADSFSGRDFVISAKDRMDYTFDRVRAVRTKRFRYIKNFFPEIPRSQPQFRDGRPFSLEFVKAFKEGKLSPVQAEYFLPTRPSEELYDLAIDPHQINNLAEDLSYREQLLKHRNILNRWISETDDQGAYPESDLAIKEIIDMWGDKCTSVRCKKYISENVGTINIPGKDIYPAANWPDYMPKPTNSYYEELESVYVKTQL